MAEEIQDNQTVTATASGDSIEENLSKTISQDEKDDSKILYELTDLRQKNVKQFLKDNSTIEEVVYPMAVHYTDSDGKLKDIDNTLIE